MKRVKYTAMHTNTHIKTIFFALIILAKTNDYFFKTLTDFYLHFGIIFFLKLKTLRPFHLFIKKEDFNRQKFFFVQNQPNKVGIFKCQ